MAEVPPMTVEVELKKIWKFALDPIHLILAGLLVVAWFVGTWLYASHRAAAADQAAAVSKVQAKAAEDHATQADATNKQFQADAAVREAASDQRVMQLQSEVDSLAKAMSVRNVALVQQQKTDSTLPPTQLAGRWQDLVHMPGSVLTTASGYSVSPGAAVATVQELESVPVLTQNVTDLSKAVDDKIKQIAEKDNVIALKEGEKASAATAFTAELAAKDSDIHERDLQIKKVKADASRSKHRWAVGGVIVGVTIRSLIKAFAGF